MFRDDWVALHVFYAANANPMLTEAVAPLDGGAAYPPSSVARGWS